MTTISIYSKFDSLPEEMKNEVSNFIDFLVSKSTKAKPKFGSAKGMFKMSADFDAPLEDFNKYM